MFALAHLSDVHLAPLPPPRLHELLSKRAFGYLHWQQHRRAVHRIEVVEAITRDLKGQKPDHVAVTGDLVNIAMTTEFAQARAWLDRLGAPHDVTLVPGNHDAYVRAALAHQGAHWGDYMRGDEASAAIDGAVIFPFVRRRGPLALIGLSSAIPSAPFLAIGRLGAMQIRRLNDLLTRLADDGLFRVVLIHHPPQTARLPRYKCLTDAAKLRQVIAQSGAELVIHGHEHISSLDWLEGPTGPVPALGVPSASATPLGNGRHESASYNIYRIGGTPGRWTCEVITRGFRAGEQSIIELARRTLSVPLLG